jgi:hypothetical protein
MTHENAGRYAAKHPEGAKPDPRVAEALKTKIKDGAVSCAAAHRIARALNLLPKEVGRTMDLMELKIVKCQMGLFGYTPEKKIVQPADTVSPELEAAITAEWKDGRLSCRTAWDIADRFGISRMEMASACEALAVKVSPCQIGAF